MKDYKAAIIGCGARGGMHASAYSRISEGTVTACCDIDEDKAAGLAGDFGIQGYTDVEKMIAAEKPDIVHITTPPTARYSLLEIDLLTGRKNQIRVHLADKGCPVAGDKKYGGKKYSTKKKKGIRRLTLHAASVTIVHPHSKEQMTFAL